MGAGQSALCPQRVLPAVRTLDRAGQPLGMMDLHGNLATLYLNFLLITAISMLVPYSHKVPDTIPALVSQLLIYAFFLLG